MARQERAQVLPPDWEQKHQERETGQLCSPMVGARRRAASAEQHSCGAHSHWQCTTRGAPTACCAWSNTTVSHASGWAAHAAAIRGVGGGGGQPHSTWPHQLARTHAPPARGQHTQTHAHTHAMICRTTAMCGWFRRRISVEAHGSEDRGGSSLIAGRTVGMGFDESTTWTSGVPWSGRRGGGGGGTGRIDSSRVPWASGIPSSG